MDKNSSESVHVNELWMECIHKFPLKSIYHHRSIWQMTID